MLYLSFKFVRKFKFCVSPLVKRYPRSALHVLHKKKGFLERQILLDASLPHTLKNSYEHALKFS